MNRQLKWSSVELTEIGLSAVRTTSSEFWDQLLCAVGTVPRQVNEISGASGLLHPVLACGVDDARRRLIIISRDKNGRAAAMAQADIQAALDSIRVIVCRPVITGLFRKDDNRDQVAHILREGIIGGASDVMGHWTESLNALPADTPMTMDNALEAKIREAVTRVDLRTGICPIVLDDFSRGDIELISSGREVDETKMILKRLNLLQYFFPSPDQLALGLVDRGALTRSRLISDLEMTPRLGHPFGPGELGSETSLADIVDVLQERGLIVEGELSLETTAVGDTIRSSVRFKPREGIVSKVLNRVSVTLNLKDLFGSG